MKQIVDVKEGLLHASQLKTRHVLIFIMSTLLVLIIVPFLMIFSSDKYFINLIFTIIISSIYLCYFIFYITVLRNNLNYELDFFKGASKSDLVELNIEVGEFLENKVVNNGREYYALEAKTYTNTEYFPKELYFINKEKDLKKGQKIKVLTYTGVVISLEEIQ